MSTQLLNDISEQLQKGRSKAARESVLQAIEQGLSVKDILEKGLLVGTK